MADFRTYNQGYQAQGDIMQRVSFAKLLDADNEVVNPNLGTLLKLSSDDTTATNRTFTLLNGQFDGQDLMILFLSGSSYTCDLQNTGNVKLSTAWQPLQYEVLHLFWDGTYWQEASRSVLQASGVTTAMLADDAVTSAKIADDDGAMKHARVTVDYTDLNTAGTGVAHLEGPTLPDNSIVYQVLVDVTTTFAGDGDDGSTLKIGIEDQDNDTVAAVAISDGANPWDAGIKAAIEVGTAATAVKLSAARQVATTWTAAGTDTALTAGQMDIHVFYVTSAA